MGDTRPRLSASTLTRAGSADVPRYDRGDAVVGIVHIGLGAFARAHVATYADDLLAAGHEAGICGVSLHSHTTIGALRDQDGLYTVVERDRDETALRVIGSVLDLAHGPAEAVDALTSPDVHTVTITVTEKGYCTMPATDEIDESLPEIRHDLAHPDDPVSMPGVLAAALRHRHERGLPAPTIISCDNLHDNGGVTARVVSSLARRADPATADWIGEEVAFPSTVVDRIVPATTDADRRLVVERMGLVDEAAVSCEPFRRWVIEEARGTQVWEAAGATIADSVEPWETLKLRLLNGPHSALAYLGLAAGIRTIAEAVSDPALAGFVAAMAEHEIIPALPEVATDPSAYAAACRLRFANTALRHRTAQVAMDGSQKLPPRVLAPMLAARERGLAVDRLALVVAAWMRHIAHCRSEGLALEDPLAEEFAARLPNAPVPAEVLADRLLGVEAVFAYDLAGDNEVRRDIVRGLELLEEVGPLDAAARIS